MWPKIFLVTTLFAYTEIANARMWDPRSDTKFSKQYALEFGEAKINGQPIPLTVIKDIANYSDFVRQLKRLLHPHKAVLSADQPSGPVLVVLPPHQMQKPQESLQTAYVFTSIRMLENQWYFFGTPAAALLSAVKQETQYDGELLPRSNQKFSAKTLQEFRFNKTYAMQVMGILQVPYHQCQQTLTDNFTAAGYPTENIEDDVPSNQIFRNNQGASLFASFKPHVDGCEVFLAEVITK